MTDASPYSSGSSFHDPFVLVGGTIHDPKNGLDGIVTDIWVEAGRIVCSPSDTKRFCHIDATGLIVMPGGIDLHSHVAGPKVNTGRRMSPQLGTRAGAITSPVLSRLFTQQDRSMHRSATPLFLMQQLRLEQLRLLQWN